MLTLTALKKCYLHVLKSEENIYMKRRIVQFKWIAILYGCNNINRTIIFKVKRTIFRHCKEDLEEHHCKEEMKIW